MTISTNFAHRGNKTAKQEPCRDSVVATCQNISVPCPVYFLLSANLALLFCDYCDVYLTHDSMSVRKAHNSGRNHLRNVVDYYQRMSRPSASGVSYSPP